MLNYDDVLQKKLDELENGASLESVISSLPGEAGELESLIRLAAAVRSIPHPEPAASQVAAQRQEVLAAAVRNTQPVNRPVRDTNPASSRAPRFVHDTLSAVGGRMSAGHTSGGTRSEISSQVRRPAWKWITPGTLLAAAGAMALFIVLVLVGAGFWLSGRDKDTARVEDMAGQVQIATDLAGARWKNIAVGARLHRGDRLRTLGASSATLIFFEGTHIFVSPDSELTFAELHGSARNTLQVKINQTSGETWNKVTPFNGNRQSFFLVQTPSGTASVHGTSFNVRVNQGGQAQFGVDTGQVEVKNSASEVTLQAGQATTASPSGTIAAPTYQFSVQGSLLSIDEANGIWTVSGMQVKVSDFTAITGFTGAPQLGDTIKVTGRILDDVTWIADAIEPGTDDGQAAYFTGILENNAGDRRLISRWQISGVPVNVSGETQLDPNLAPGTPVKVSYNILEDGTWLALKIESLLEAPVAPTAIPTATSDPNAMPSYQFLPGEIETQGCGSSDFSLNGSLRNTAGQARDYAANVQLGYLIDRGGEFVSTVAITPDSWTRIDAGQTVPLSIHVTMNDRWAATPGNGSLEDIQVKLRIFITSATNQPGHLNGSLTITIEAGCSVTPTPVASETPLTPTASLTGTLTPEITGTLTPTAPNPPEAPFTPTAAAPAPASAAAWQCTGADPQPTGMKLAQRYHVPYEEIMTWFCQHYGFGEIDLAYSLSYQTGRPVAEIFAMRASGMGWGEIKKALLPGNGKPDDGNQDGKDKGNGKDKHNK